jgi:Icc-related predicted phosphoesterase
MGRTLAVNPGSTYVEGTLSGCLLQLDGKDKIKQYRLVSG